MTRCRTRDALAQTLYARLFAWIVRTINAATSPAHSSANPRANARISTPAASFRASAFTRGTIDTSIAASLADPALEPSLEADKAAAGRNAEAERVLAVLDPCGFETSSGNSLEQLLINLADERVQQVGERALTAIVAATTTWLCHAGVPAQALGPLTRMSDRSNTTSAPKHTQRFPHPRPAAPRAPPRHSRRQAFLQHSFHREAALHREEHVAWPQIELPDNSGCVAALMSPPSGVLVLLEASTTEHAFFEAVSREVTPPQP